MPLLRVAALKNSRRMLLHGGKRASPNGPIGEGKPNGRLIDVHAQLSIQLHVRLAPFTLPSVGALHGGLWARRRSRAFQSARSTPSVMARRPGRHRRLIVMTAKVTTF